MKALVLAAGRGERLLPLTLDRPKPLVDLGDGRTLLDEQLASFVRVPALDDVVLIVGYRAEMVERHVRARRLARPALRTLFNPFYGVANNLLSLWLGRGEMDGDFLVTNGDNLFAGDVMADMLAACGPGIHLALCPRRSFDADDMKAMVRRGRVVAVNKTLDARRCRAESPGLAVVRGRAARQAFVSALEHLAREPEAPQRFWLEVFNALAATGTVVRPWYFTGEDAWQEIDFHADMRAAQALLAGKLARLRRPSLRKTA